MLHGDGFVATSIHDVAFSLRISRVKTTTTFYLFFYIYILKSLQRAAYGARGKKREKWHGWPPVHQSAVLSLLSGSMPVWSRLLL